jgi:hypothetical protein
MAPCIAVDPCILSHLGRLASRDACLPPDRVSVLSRMFSVSSTALLPIRVHAGILILLQEDRNVHDQIIGAVWLGAGASHLGKDLEQARSRASGSAAHTDKQTDHDDANQEKTNYANKSEGRSRATHLATSPCWSRDTPVRGRKKAATVRLRLEEELKETAS